MLTLVVAAGGVFVVVWVLNKVGKALTALLEALATLAAVFLALSALAPATLAALPRIRPLPSRAYSPTGMEPAAEAAGTSSYCNLVTGLTLLTSLRTRLRLGRRDAAKRSQ